MDVLVESYSTGCEFLNHLGEVKPSQVILMEPHLSFMRSLEVHSAERLMAKSDDRLAVLLLKFKDSTELYQHMTSIENEKRAFADIISMKSKLTVQIKDYELEA